MLYQKYNASHISKACCKKFTREIISLLVHWSQSIRWSCVTLKSWKGLCQTQSSHRFFLVFPALLCNLVLACGFCSFCFFFVLAAIYFAMKWLPVVLNCSRSTLPDWLWVTGWAGRTRLISYVKTSVNVGYTILVNQNFHLMKQKSHHQLLHEQRFW